MAPPPPRDPGGRFLPSRETLEKRSVPDLVETMRRFGSPVTEAQLETMAERLTERLRAAPAPDVAVLEAEVDRLERALQTALASEAKRLRQELELRAHGLRGTRGARDVDAQWIAVGDTNTCPSCDERAGDVRTMRQWDAAGLPGSPNLICWSRCRCYLVPEDWIGADAEEDAA